MYYQLESSPWEKYGVTTWPELPENVFAFHSGDYISVKVPEPVVFIVDNTSEHPPTDLVTSFMPVFSEQLLASLHKAGVDNMQTYQAVLKNTQTGEQWDGYKVGNILGKVACADLENSTYTDSIGDKKNFTELVIDVEKAKGALFFRLLESHSMIIIHDKVLDYLYNEDDDPIFRGLEITAIKSSHNINQK